jgi:transcriptional regulator with XRE-family HTH domain
MYSFEYLVNTFCGVRMKTIGERLREERERLEMSQTAFAAVGGVLKGAQLNYEAGKRVPDADYLAGIAKAGVDVLYVITGQAADSPAPPPLKDGEATLLESYRALDKRGQAAVLAVIATMSEPEPSSKGRTKAPSREQAIGVHVTQHAHGNDTTQVGSVKNLRIARKSK